MNRANLFCWGAFSQGRSDAAVAQRSVRKGALTYSRLQVPVPLEQKNLSSWGAYCDGHGDQPHRVCGQHHTAVPGQARGHAGAQYHWQQNPAQVELTLLDPAFMYLCQHHVGGRV